MVTARSMVRAVVLAGVMATVIGVPQDAFGQLARPRSNERILVLSPFPAATADSAYALAFGNEFRDRWNTKYRFRLPAIASETICEALEASGFNCSHPLPPDNAPALARFLQATGYAVSWLRRERDSVIVRVRMVETARSGLAGWDRFAAPAATSATDFARQVADGLENHVRASEFARECSERRERSDARGAAGRAERAFEIIPNHPAAAMCLALVHEVQRNPLDSVVAALRKAVAGDSLNIRAWEDLGRRLQDKGDTAGALRAFQNQLRADPTDMRLRLGVAAALTSNREFAAAAELLSEGLATNPGDLPMLALKERACLEGSLWRCGLEALEAQFQIDTSLAKDSVFYQKAFGAAQSIPDTAAMVEWSRRAVDRFPGSISLWRARAAALKTADRRHEALEAYDRIIALDSTQAASALAAAQFLLDSTLVIDTGVRLDTARILKAERLLDIVAAQARGDTVTLVNVAALLYNPAAKIAQVRLLPHLPLAARFLEKALQHDLRGSLRVPANFFLGLAYFFHVTQTVDPQVRASKSCDMVDVEIEMVAKAKQALTQGRSISPQVADQLLGFVRQLEGALPTYKPAFRCAT